MSARQLSKSFGPVEVLHAIDLEIRAGQIQALLGENGAGKSTLVKILSGFEACSSGELKLYDQNNKNILLQRWNNEIAERSGVVLIHQEFNLVEQLTVAENIFLGNEVRRGWFLNKKAMTTAAAGYLQQLQCAVNPGRLVQDLAVSDKQMVEIAKALAKKSRLLILDEPTAILTRKESEVLFALLMRLREQGIAIVYISHKLDEIELLADVITILRDGTRIGSYAAQELSKDDMARLMVGRELTSLFPPLKSVAANAETVLQVDGIQVQRRVPPASFSLRRGEVLGFAGLVGSGRTALMECIAGLRTSHNTANARIEIRGKRVSFRNAAQARDKGLAYLTKDRKGCGLLLNMGLTENFSLFSLHKFSKGLIDRKKEQQAFTRAITTFDIRLTNSSAPAAHLSGGNQQKLLLAKILEAGPEILIIDEPTRGIDIGTKSQIYHFIAELVAAGLSVILISSDISEIIGLSNRVAVMYHSSIAGILEGDEINEHEIMRYATGLKQQTDSEKLCA